MRQPEVYEYDDGTLDVVIESRTEDGKRRRVTHANVTPEEASRLVSEHAPKRRRLTDTKPSSGPIDWPAHLTNIPADPVAHVTLTEFLLARISEDAADAAVEAAMRDVPFTADRDLAECASKRRIVEMATDPEWCGNRVGDVIATQHLRILAEVYSDHPDYDDSWRA